MERYLFHYEEYEKFYNCSMQSPEKWHSYGKVHKPLGIVYMSIGIMYEILYFPCLYVMASPKFMRLSCYKIMYYLGVIDVLCIINNSIISGFLSIEGDILLEIFMKLDWFRSRFLWLSKVDVHQWLYFIGPLVFSVYGLHVAGY